MGDHDVVVEALTAIVRNHLRYGRWIHFHLGADRTPDSADVHAEVAHGRVLVCVHLPAEDTTPA